MSPATEYSRRTGLALFGLCTALLLAAAVAPVATAEIVGTDGPQPEIVAAENTTSYLQPSGDGPTRQWLGRQDVDPSVAITNSAHRLHGDQERAAFDRRFFETDSQEERARLLRQQTAALERQVEDVMAAHRSARRAYTSDEASTSDLLRTLARVDAAATRANRLRNLLENRSVQTGPRQSYHRTLDNLAVDLASVRGPATRQVRETLSGEIDGRPIYVEAVGEEGLVVATTDATRFYREAYDGTKRQEGGENRFASGSEIGIGVAYSRAAELYPWIFSNNVAPPPARGFGNTSVYLISVDHSQGSMSTYLDGSTESVFREIQQKRLDAVPLSRMGAETEDDLRLTVNGTHPSGPVQIRLQRATTGTPVDAEVHVNGRFVGTTGPDGRLWTLQPAVGFTVNATAGSDSVSATMP